MMPSHRPETDAALLARFALPYAQASKKILPDLIRTRTPITLYAQDDEEFLFCSHLCGFDAQRGSLRFETPSNLVRQGLALPCSRFLAVAIYARVKIQFAVRLHSAIPDAVTGEIVTEAPETISRLQRRDAYRVELTSDASSHLLLPATQAGGKPCQARMLDLSVTGLSFVLPHDFQTPALEHEYIGAQIVLSQGPHAGASQATVLNCDLVVRRLGDIPAHERAQARIGCAILSLSGSSERALQLFINAEQIRQRSRRKVLGD